MIGSEFVIYPMAVTTGGAWCAPCTHSFGYVRLSQLDGDSRHVAVGFKRVMFFLSTFGIWVRPDQLRKSMGYVQLALWQFDCWPIRTNGAKRTKR